ncbi:MAG: calcium/sodium antiporter [bacterium]|nr:calcium/sodium antiporter [bacterium]
MLFGLIFAFLGGVLLLWKGADFLVAGSSVLARRFGIPPLVIGLTIVALGTSLPELVVSLFAAIQHSSDLLIGNIVGSNISNILLILGATAVIAPLAVQSSTIWKEIPFSFFAVVVLGVQANDIFFRDGSANIIGRGNGLILLVFFVLYLYYVFALTKQYRADERIKDVKADLKESRFEPLWKLLLKIGGGFLLLIVGGRAVVFGGGEFARLLGVSEAVIGLTMVAIGTSLPELATSVAAALRKEADIAVGNIVGSNIFNIFFVLGVSAAVQPLAFPVFMNNDVLFLILATLILFVATLLMGRKLVITRGNGVGFLVVYVCYVAFVYLRKF